MQVNKPLIISVFISLLINGLNHGAIPGVDQVKTNLTGCDFNRPGMNKLFCGTEFYRVTMLLPEPFNESGSHQNSSSTDYHNVWSRQPKYR